MYSYILLVLLVLYTNFLIALVSGAYLETVRSKQTVPDKLIVPKCCGVNQVAFFNLSTFTSSCEEYIGERTFEHMTIYDKDIHDKPLSKPFTDVFRVSAEARPDEENFTMYLDVYIMMKQYLSIDGTLYMEHANAYDRLKPVNNSYYCADYVVDENGTLSEDFRFFCIFPSERPKETSIYLKVALVVSLLFLFIVLLVYMLLPGLRNLCGMILMAYVFSLMFAFISLSAIQFGEFLPETCVKLTITTYFFFLASFCWMNVMSYDIWWTFRGYAKARPIHRRGETFKFLMYCIYGWGVPLAMAIFFKVINSADLSDKPWFVKPLVPELGCFIEGGQKLVYLYAPMLILIICNWIFFLMTAFNIWRLNRETAMLDSPAAGTPAAHRNQRARFFIYLKLSIIMGINWVLEVVSALTPDFEFWFISDLYNLLIGLSIFLIFVCKKKIYLQLKARFRRHQQPQRALHKSQTSCTTLSNSSQDTPMQVYRHPNGSSVRR